jgi:hypothetical protein
MSEVKELKVPDKMMRKAMESKYGAVWYSPQGAVYIDNRGNVSRREWLDHAAPQIPLGKP